MKKTIIIAGVIALAMLGIALLIGLALVTVWLFHKGLNSDWSAGIWISVLIEGIGAIILIPLEIPLIVHSAKKRIGKIRSQ